MNKIDVIIPTIMCTDIHVFGYTLSQLYNAPEVNSVMVIDNTEDQEFTSKMGILAEPKVFPKLRKINGFKHGFLVNDAWNYGIDHCQCPLAPYYCLLNDDIIIKSETIADFRRIMDIHADISLLTITTLNNVALTDYIDAYFPKEGKLTDIIPNGRQGWLMVGRKHQYVPIPDTLKLFYGDDWIYMNARERGRATMLTYPYVSHFQSSSVNSNIGKLKPIIDSDEKAWHSIYKKKINEQYRKGL